MSAPPFRAPGMRWPVPSCLTCVGLFVMGLAGWTVFSALEYERQLERLFDSEVSAIERVQSAEQWAKQGADAIPRLREALKSPDAKTRKFTLLALIYMAREHARLAEPDILPLLDDPDIQVQANALVLAANLAKNPEDIAPRLASRLLSSESYLVESAEIGLHKLGPAATPAITAILPQASPRIQILCLDLVKHHIFDEEHGGRAVSTLSDSLRSPHAEVRRRAYQLVSIIRPLRPEEVAAGLSDSDRGIVKIALKAWTQDPVRIPGMAARLAGLLETQPDLAEQVLEALAVFGPSESDVFPAILKWTSSQDPALRGAAAKALVRTAEDAERVRPVLMSLLLDAHPRVSRESARLLAETVPAELPDIVRHVLLPRLYAEEESVQLSAAAALSGMPQAALAERVVLVRRLGMLSSDKPVSIAVQYELAEALGNMGPAARDVGPAILKLLRRTPPWDPRIQIPVRVLGKIGARDPEVLEALIELHATREIRRPLLRVAFIEALGELGGRNRDVFRLLSGILQLEESPRLRLAALRAIGRLRIDAVIAQETFLLALKDENVNVRIAACLLLAERGDSEERVLHLAGMLRDESYFVRILAAQLLAEKGTEAAEAVPILLQASSDPENRLAHNLFEWEEEEGMDGIQWEQFDPKFQALNRHSVQSAVRSALEAIQHSNKSRRGQVQKILQ